jgi:hypothetical protein
MLGDSEFADLSGFHSTAFDGELEHLKAESGLPEAPSGYSSALPFSDSIPAPPAEIVQAEAERNLLEKNPPFQDGGFDVTDLAAEDPGEDIFD